MRNCRKIISQFKNKKILVVGDVMLDRYTFGQVSKISQEAPILVVEKTGEHSVLGGAGNVAANVAGLGATVFLCGVVGADKNRELLLQLLRVSRIDVSSLYTHPSKPTIEKHRIIAGDNHQLLRVDIEDSKRLKPAEEKKILARLQPLISRCDAVILSDYAKGFFSPALTRSIIETAKKRRKIILADFKPSQKEYFRGVDVISPNIHEGQAMTGLKRANDIGAALVKQLGAHVVLTRGGEGISVFYRDGNKVFHIPGKKIEIFDVTGAGDTAIAVLALGLVSSLDIELAATLANEASALVVQKPRTATISPKELIAV